MARKMKDSGIEWIGEIPVDWNVVKVKKIVKSIDNGVWGDDPIPGIETYKVLRSTEQTVDGQWNISVPAERDLSSIPSLSKYAVQENDLLITKSSGSNDHIGKTTLVTQEIAKQKFFYSNFLGRIRVSERYSSKLLWYILNSSVARSQFVHLQNSTSGLGNINSEMIGNLWLPMMSLTNQNRIASFLDSKCAEIDKAVEATKASIEEYKKLRQAIITEAVTKGLDPNVEMKDSGIEWLGSFPSEWEWVPLWSLIKCRISGSWGNDPKNDNNDRACMRIADFDYDKLSFKKDLVPTMRNYSIEEIENKALSYGDLLIEKSGGGEKTPVGRAVVYRGKGNELFANFMDCIRFNAKIDVEFAKYIFASLYSRRYTNLYFNQTTGLQNFNTSRFICETFLPLPCLFEQERIASYLDAKCSEIDSIIKSKEKLIEELTAYRKSLIYEYVTGKKEVPIESA